MEPNPPAIPANLETAIARWITDLTYGGVFATDADLRVITWNRWMEVHTRRPAAEVVGQSLLQLYPDLVSRGIDRRYREALVDGHISTLAYGLHGYVLSLPPTHPDLGGMAMPQTGRIGPLHDGNAIVGTVTVIENVSERLVAEAELRKQVEAQQVARATAERALRDKDEFLSLLSHELRTPLNAVLGWARILLSRKESNPEVILRALEIIERNAAAQAAMIDDILDVARVVSGKLRLEMAPTDLAPVIFAAVDVVTPSARAKQLTVTAELDPAAPPVLGDPGRLQQIVWNLLSNAVKFTEPGGSIAISLSCAGDKVQLVVRDTGHGIAPSFLPLVFDRFRQSDASSSRRQGGLGLGLALVRDLVQLHGGTIRAESPGEGHGSVFTIELAAFVAPDAGLRADADARAADERSAALALENICALVVEDDPDSRELLVASLVRYGAEVVAVESSDAAVARLLSESQPKIDVLISDIGLPAQDGYELIRRVRALERPAISRIPALALTGYATDNDRGRALEAGYHGHIAKPIDPSAVALAIRRAIQNAAVS